MILKLIVVIIIMCLDSNPIVNNGMRWIWLIKSQYNNIDIDAFCTNNAYNIIQTQVVND